MVTTLAKEDRHNKNRAIDKRRGWVSLVTIIIKFCEKELVISGFRGCESQLGTPVKNRFGFLISSHHQGWELDVPVF